MYHTCTSLEEVTYKLYFLSLSSVADTAPFDVQAEVTLRTNFFATRDMLTHFLPIVKPGGEDSGPPSICRCSSPSVWRERHWVHEVCVSRSCGERLQLRELSSSDPVQPGAPEAFPQRGHHRGRAGGTDAAVCRRHEEERAQAGRLAWDGVRRVQDRPDGTTRE